MDEKQKDTLYFPQGLKRKREYFSGYGQYELNITIIATLITALLSYFTYLISRNIVLAILFLLVVPTTTVVFIVRNECNISVVSQLKFMVQFIKDQKKYYYVYQDEWTK